MPTFPDTQFAGLGLVDYTTGATAQEFFAASQAAQWDDEIIALTSQLRSGLFRVVFNNTGSVLSKGKPVKISGFNGANSVPEVALAQANANANFADGVVLSDIAVASLGIIVKRRVIKSLDTSTFTLLDDVFLSASVAGGLTAVIGRQRLGRVTVVNVTTGEIEFDIDRGGVGNSPPDAVTLEDTGTVLQIKAASVGESQLAIPQREFRFVKSSDIGITASITLTDVPGFSKLLPSTGKFYVKLLLFVNQAAGVAGLKIRLDYSAVLIISRIAVTDTGLDNKTFNAGGANSASAQVDNDISIPMASAGDYALTVEGSFQAGSVGTLKLQFAQSVSDAGTTTIKDGSLMIVKPF